MHAPVLRDPICRLANPIPSRDKYQMKNAQFGGHMTDLRALMNTIPQLQGYDGPVERMGGLTNVVHRVGEYCLRVPGEGTEEYIDRKAEAVAAQAAAEAGVSPELVFADPDSGLMVTRFIDGATTMTPDLFAQAAADDSHAVVGRAAIAMRDLHRSGAVFPADFELFAMIDEYLGLLSTKDVDLPAGYHDVVAEAETIRTALAKNPAPRVACHCDPLCENFLDTGTRMWIVDWEYSGMNDPMWDLGDLSVEAGLNDVQDAALLAAYFDGQVPAHDHARMVIYKAMCDLLWTLWGLIQLANDNPAEDFRAYADGRFARCKALMARPEFAAHVATLNG
jgi:thiamine kinase-like enzyme